MEPMTEHEIRAAFVNCTKGEAKRLYIPRDLAERPWEHLDFLGWRDPHAANRAYLVIALNGRPHGIAMRCPSPAAGPSRSVMCSICLTTHSGGGVSQMVATKAGKAGRQGNSVGTYICSDLCCSLYLRGRKRAGPWAHPPETITLDEKIQRTVRNVAAFVSRIYS